MTITVTYSLVSVATEHALNGFTPGNQSDAHLVGLSNGGFAISYVNHRTSGDSAAVSLFQADGSAIAGANGAYTMVYQPSSTGVRLESDLDIMQRSDGDLFVSCFQFNLPSKREVFGSHHIQTAVIDAATGLVKKLLLSGGLPDGVVKATDSAGAPNTYQMVLVQDVGLARG